MSEQADNHGWSSHDAMLGAGRAGYTEQGRHLPNRVRSSRSSQVGLGRFSIPWRWCTTATQNKCEVCENPRRSNPERARRSSTLSFHQEFSSPPPARKKKSSPPESASSQGKPSSQSSGEPSLVITLDDDSPKPSKPKAPTPRSASTAKPRGRKRLRRSTSSDEGSEGEESELELTQEEEQWAAKQKGGKGKGKGGRSTPNRNVRAKKPPPRKADDSDISSDSSDSSSSSSSSSIESEDGKDHSRAKRPIRRVTRGRPSRGGGVEVIELEEDEEDEEVEEREEEQGAEEERRATVGSRPSGGRVKRDRADDEGSATDGSDDLLAFDVAGLARRHTQGPSSTRPSSPLAPVQVTSSPVRRASSEAARSSSSPTTSPMVVDLSSEGAGDTEQAEQGTGEGEEEGEGEVGTVGVVVCRQTADDPLAALLEADACGWDGGTHLPVKRRRTSTSHGGGSGRGVHAWHPLYRDTDALPSEVLFTKRPYPLTLRNEQERAGGAEPPVSPSSSVATASPPKPREARPPPVTAVPSFKMTLANDDDDEDESDEDEDSRVKEGGKAMKREPLSLPPLSTQEAAATLKTLVQGLDLPPQNGHHMEAEPASNLNGPQGWACRICTYDNSADTSTCHMCQTPRDTDTAKGEHEVGPIAIINGGASGWHEMEDPGGMEHHDDDDLGLCPSGSFSDNGGDEEEDANENENEEEEDIVDGYGDGEEEWEEWEDEGASVKKPAAKRKTEICDLTFESSGDEQAGDSDDVQDFEEEEAGLLRRGGPVPPDYDFLPHFRSITQAQTHGGLTVNFEEMLRMDDASVAGYDKRRKTREARDSKKSSRRKKGGGKKRAWGGKKAWGGKRAKT